MITQRGFFRILAGVVVVLLGACSGHGETEYRYKLTVVVDTPGGIRSGSSVIQVIMTSPMKGAEALGGSGPSARGEAVAVNLPNGETLFVLLRSETDMDWAGSAHIESTGLNQDDFADKASFRETLRTNRIVYPVQRWVETGGGEKIDNYPMMVMFDDIQDPEAVRRVDPDDLAASFGAGYKLKAVTVVGTDEPMTTGIEKKLEWLNSTKGALLKVDIAEHPALGVPLPFAANITDRDFRAGG